MEEKKGTEIIKQGMDIAIISEEAKEKLRLFTRRLHEEPAKEEIQTNPAANNSRYIPISFLEMKLDEIFEGQWSVKNFQSRTIANEEVGSLELWFLHPVTNTWLCRVGAGAVMIQFKQGSDIADGLTAKIKNTLTKDYPHLKAECFRNACLSIGKMFGRDLNRKLNDQYNPFEEPKPIDQKLADELEKRLLEFDSYKDLYSKAKTIRDEFVKEGLPIEYCRTEIRNRLEVIK